MVSSASPEEQITPEPASFAAFDLCPQIKSAIASLGFRDPTLVQQKVIPLALEGRDVAAKARTGSGKTAAYLIPMLNHFVLHPREASGIKEALMPRGLVLVPTKELADQVEAMVKAFCKFSNNVEFVNLCSKINLVQQQQALAQGVEIIISTPSRLPKPLENLDADYLHSLQYLVVDEADLLLSFGYQDDIKMLLSHLPVATSYQTFLMSATLEKRVSDFAGKLLVQPVYLDLTEAEGANRHLSQFVVQFDGKNADRDKFLLMYFILKLRLIRGKLIIFVNNIDRGFRLRLFLEQFAIRSVVLNSELPLSSRMHIVSEFNRGAYDILIASDEGGKGDVAESLLKDEDEYAVPGNVGEEEDGEDDGDDNLKGFNERDDGDIKSFDETDEGANAAEDTALKGESADRFEHDEDTLIIEDSAQTNGDMKEHRRGQKRKDSEYGVSRGIDFQNVTAVVNFDFPGTVQSYTHRIGRTARGGRKGMALSFVLNDERARVVDIKRSDRFDELAAFRKVSAAQKKSGAPITPYAYNHSQVDAFRYRMEDAMRTVTSTAVREARIAELKKEVMRSEKLRAHFEDHAADLAFLRHDNPIAPARIQPHLKNTPAYLLPEGVKEIKVSSVPFHKNSGKRKRGNQSGRGGRSGHGGNGSKKRKHDPLKKLKV